uniref:ANK_REP_REGION domain-containing protein n=1 Tax=Macrostomum lignano TaxID=282301 RepID=A0A1I8HE04_9PLAT
MDLLQSESVRQTVLTLCDILGSSQSKRNKITRSEACPILRLTPPTTSDSQDANCEILIASLEAEDSEDTTGSDQTPYAVVSSLHSVKVTFTGLPNLSERFSATFPPVLGDLCRLVSQLIKVTGVKQLRIQVDPSTAERIPQSSVQPKLLDNVSIRHFLSSAFVFCHLLRVPGETRLESLLDLKAGDALVTIGDQPQCSMRVAVSSCLNGEDEAVNEELEHCIAESSKRSAPVYLCILFNEIRTCEWYLKTRKEVECQRKRLPNHDVTRVQVKSDSGLKIRVILFDFQQGECYQDTGALPAEQVLSEFSDDQFLRAAVSKCEQLAQEHSFQLECFTVPCRNTAHMLQAAAEVAQEAQKQSAEAASPAHTPGALHFLAATGDASKLAQLLEADPSVLQDPHKSFPHRTALLCAAAASVADFSQGSEAHAECFEILISRGADPQAADSRKHSVWHCAVLSNNIPLLNTLLANHRADINSADGSCMTPLLLAVEEENAPVAEMLLDNGANSQLTDKAGQSALTMAVSAGNLELVKTVLKHEPEILRDSGAEKYASIYWSAWKQGYQDICLHLLHTKFGLTEHSISEAEKLNCLIS